MGVKQQLTLTCVVLRTAFLERRRRSSFYRTAILRHPMTAILSHHCLLRPRGKPAKESLGQKLICGTPSVEKETPMVWPVWQFLLSCPQHLCRGGRFLGSQAPLGGPPVRGNVVLPSGV